MRPAEVSLSAVGFSPWIPIDRYVVGFGVAVGVKFSSDATMTVSVQHTLDDLYQVLEPYQFSLSRSGTTCTLNLSNHGLSVGDWVKVFNAGSPFDGEYLVETVEDANNVTFTVSNTDATTGGPYRRLQWARVFNHAVLAGITSSQDSNYAYPPRACRLRCTAYTSGTATLTVVPGGMNV